MELSDSGLNLEVNRPFIYLQSICICKKREARKSIGIGGDDEETRMFDGHNPK